MVLSENPFFSDLVVKKLMHNHLEKKKNDTVGC